MTGSSKLLELLPLFEDFSEFDRFSLYPLDLERSSLSSLPLATFRFFEKLIMSSSSVILSSAEGSEQEL